MPTLGSSPLGLVVSSEFDNKNAIGTYERGQILEDKNLYKSLFQNTAFTPYSSGSDDKGIVTSSTDVAELNVDDIYNTSVSSLIDYTSKYPSMRLLASDFAYLKNLGVFPNNRLMIARRFPSAVSDDLTTIKSTPLSTLISWVPDGNDFISMSFGEEWVDADTSIKEVLNEIGKDITTTGIGNIGAAGGNVVPLPGFMEGLQYKVMKEMGIVNDGDEIPAGNPNLIRQAKMRKTFKDDEKANGVKCDFEITMVVEYEQKFINGIDPTLVYFDIVSNILSFGTSDSYFQFNSKFASAASRIITDLISGDLNKIADAIGKFVTSLVKAIQSVANELLSAMSKASSSASDDGGGFLRSLISGATPVLKETVGKVIKKYKLRLMGIANALTGTNSAPWHITIGNPKKPLFSSGDMLPSDIKLTMGAILSYNDLPQTIRAEITLKNARDLGSNEIFKKFNNGAGRNSRKVNLSFNEYTHFTNDTQSQPYTQVERMNPNIPEERPSTTEPTPIVAVPFRQSISESSPSGLVVGNIIEPIPTTESPISTAPKRASKFEWSVRVSGGAGGDGDHASGVSATAEEAQRMIDLFATGSVIVDKVIIEVFL